MPKGIIGFSPDVTPKYGYDPEKAKALLKEAGYDKGFDVDLYFCVPRYAQFEDIVSYMQAYLAAMGIKAKPQKLAFSTQFAKMKKGEYNLTLDIWNVYYPDPTSTFLAYLHSSRWNFWGFTYWKNERVDQLLEKARDNMNRNDRDKQYREAEQIAAENAVVIPLYQAKEMIAMRDDIKNIEWHPALWYRGFKSIYRESP